MSSTPDTFTIASPITVRDLFNVTQVLVANISLDHPWIGALKVRRQTN